MSLSLQVYPLYLTPALLEQVCNNFTVIEVWHRTPGPTNEDEVDYTYQCIVCLYMDSV